MNKQVKVVLERKNFDSDLELSFRFKDNYNFEDLMLKVIKKLIKMKELENTFIYDYNGNDYLELLKYLELQDDPESFEKLIENGYTYYDFTMESLGCYMIDLNMIRIRK
jgi:hypothetical protein